MAHPQAPVSGRLLLLLGALVGVLRTGPKQLITMGGTSEQLLAQVTELAVSIELAGSGAAKPSAAFLLRGHCVKLW